MLEKITLIFGYALLFSLLRTDIAGGIEIQRAPFSLSSEHRLPISSTIQPLIHNEIETINDTTSTTEHKPTEPIRINHNRTNTPPTTETQSLITSTEATVTVNNKTQHTNGSDETAKHKKDQSSKDETNITYSTPSTPSSNPTTIHTTEKVKPSTDLPRSNDSKSDYIAEPKSKQPIETTTTAAGIVAFVCVGIACAAFLGLVAWKYMYRKRHGNREILINEEDVDFNDEDLRHFEATCIQLEPDA